MFRSLGQRIKMARETSGFTQECLAEAIGVSRTAVARWERGDSEPKLVHLICLSDLLEVSTDYLLGISSSKNTSLQELSDKAISALEKFVSEIQKN